MLETYHDSNLNSDVYELTLESSKRLWQGIAELSSRDFEGVMVQRSWRTAKNTDFSAYSITPVLPDDPAALRYPARGFRGQFFCVKALKQSTPNTPMKCGVGQKIRSSTKH